jgi:ATP-dependent exoDNAse (exonuclease V) beta subunit
MDVTTSMARRRCSLSQERDPERPTRAGHLVVCGIDPRRILLLTFSRRAAAEMQRRYASSVANLLSRAQKVAEVQADAVAV